MRLMLLLFAFLAFAGRGECARDLREESLFELAAWGTSRDVLAAVAQGMNPNMRDADGRTPLMLTMDNPDLDTMRALLVAGADPNAKDLDGNPVFSWTFRSARGTEAFRILLEYGLDVDAVERNGIPLLFLLAMGGSADELDILLRTKSVDVNGRAPSFSDIGVTALMAAAEYSNSPSVIDLLLGAGARVDALDDEGRTPLHYAAMLDEREPLVARRLLDAGADRFALDREGRTALSYAAEGASVPAMIDVFLEAGIPLSSDVHGLSPCDYLRVNSWFDSWPESRDVARRVCGGGQR